MSEGELWVFLRNVLSQGMAIQMDYSAGAFKCYEECSARLDVAARERADELMAKLRPVKETCKEPNG